MPLSRHSAATGFVAVVGVGLTAAAILATAPAKEKGPLDKFRFAAFDGFDNKPGLNWKPVRPDESHLSYEKHPGQLTIVTQKGTIHGDAEKGDGGQPAKNIYVIDNPLAPGTDFTVTTCLIEFRPAASYQQAGLILYDDDDNYLKFSRESGTEKDPGYVVLVTETTGRPAHAPAALEQDAEKLWLRLVKRGDKYEFATSTDGDKFETRGTGEWKKEGPKKIGLIAKNGGLDGVPELDARFEFFELTSR